MTGESLVGLPERLRAKIDEREALYRQLIERPCTHVGMNILGITRTVLVGLGIFGVDEREWLRTIQAHRAILERHDRPHWCVSDATGVGRAWFRSAACLDVRALASIYFLPEGEPS